MKYIISKFYKSLNEEMYKISEIFELLLNKNKRIIQRVEDEIWSLTALSHELNY